MKFLFTVKILTIYKFSISLRLLEDEKNVVKVAKVSLEICSVFKTNVQMTDVAFPAITMFSNFELRPTTASNV